MEFIDVMERVSQVVEKKLGMKPTQKIIAQYLNISPTNFANMKKRNSIPFEEINYFSAKHKISANWILFNQRCETLISQEEEFYYLKAFDKINASCGGGAIEDEAIVTRTIKVDKVVLEKLGFGKGSHLEAIKVVGDSMLPTLKDGDLALVNRTYNTYNSQDAFLVNTLDGLFIKRLHMPSSSKINLISDNDIFSNSIFSVDEVTIMGKVIGILEKNNI